MAAAFKVTGQRPDTSFTPDGRLVDAVTVTFEVPGAGVGTHTFPKADYKRAEVARVLQELADDMADIAQLGQ